MRALLKPDSIFLILASALVITACAKQKEMRTYHDLMADRAMYQDAKEKCAKAQSMIEIMSSPWCRAVQTADACQASRDRAKQTGQTVAEPNSYCPVK
jgi:hypothetical protein